MTKDLLTEIFALQRDLNRYTFEQNDIGVEYDAIPGKRPLQNQWVRNYALAMSQEIGQLFTKLNSKASFVDPEILTLDTAKLDDFVKQEPKLEKEMPMSLQ